MRVRGPRTRVALSTPDINDFQAFLRPELAVRGFGDRRRWKGIRMLSGAGGGGAGGNVTYVRVGSV